MFKKRTLSCSVLALGLMLVLVSSFSSSAATANIKAFGDDSAVVYFNGTLVGANGGLWNTLVAGDVTLVNGQNVIGAYVHNGYFGVGLIARLASDFGNLASDTSTWKCSGNVTDTWMNTSYDDGDWGVCGYQGNLQNNQKFSDCAQMDTADLPSYCSLYPFLHTNANWVWSKNTLYLRKKFSADAGSGTIRIASQGKFTVFLNGTQVQAETPTNVTTGSDGVVTTSVASTISVTLLGGDNVVGVIATDEGIGNYNGMTICVDVIEGGSVKTQTDNTWKWRDRLETDWSKASLDDTKWSFAGIDYKPNDPPGGKWFRNMSNVTNMNSNPTSTANWIWSKDLYFRKTFTFDGSTISGADGVIQIANHSIKTRAAIVRTDYYTILGQKLPKLTNAVLKTNTIIIKRMVLANGNVVTEKIHAGR